MASTVYTSSNTSIQTLTDGTDNSTPRGSHQETHRHEHLSLPQAEIDISDEVDPAVAAARPDPSQYTRVDEAATMLSLIKDSLHLSEEEALEHSRNNHAIYGSLLGRNKIEAYEIYKKNDSSEVKSIVRIGGSLSGYPGVVHGGITSLLFDNTYGWLFISLDIPKSMTASLTVNYRRPILAGNVFVITAKLQKVEGRKLMMEATWSDAEGNVLADSHSLFITIKK